MALDLSALTGLGKTISDLLAKVQGEAPAIVDSVKSLADQGQQLFETVKANLSQLGASFGGKMTEAETRAAIDAGIARLKADMDTVDAAPKTGQQIP